jgi:hypothetical protein
MYTRCAIGGWEILRFIEQRPRKSWFKDACRLPRTGEKNRVAMIASWWAAVREKRRFEAMAREATRQIRLEELRMNLKKESSGLSSATILNPP